MVIQCRKCLQTGRVKVLKNAPFCAPSLFVMLKSAVYCHTGSSDHYWRKCIQRSYAFEVNSTATTQSEFRSTPKSDSGTTRLFIHPKQLVVKTTVLSTQPHIHVHTPQMSVMVAILDIRYYYGDSTPSSNEGLTHMNKQECPPSNDGWCYQHRRSCVQ